MYKIYDNGKTTPTSVVRLKEKIGGLKCGSLVKHGVSQKEWSLMFIMCMTLGECFWHKLVVAAGSKGLSSLWETRGQRDRNCD